MGVAMGCVGMSFADFCRCTPSQFDEIFRAWQLSRERAERNQWETSRFIATCLLQPYSKRKLRPTDVATFSWDAQLRKAPAEKSTREDFEKAVARYGA